MVAVCPHLLSTGVCTDASCTCRHDVHICRPCGVVCTSAQVYASHLSSRRHRSNLSGNAGTSYCTVCHMNVGGGRQSWTMHITGRRHIRNANQSGLPPDVDPEEATTLPGSVYCDVCKNVVPENLWSRHPSSRTHQNKLRFATFEAAFDEATKDKHGVTVSYHPTGVDFGIVDVPHAQQGIASSLSVRSTVPLSKIDLVDVRLSSTVARKASPFSLEFTSGRLIFGKEAQVNVSFKREYRGSYEDRAELVFEDTSLRQQFVIVRIVRAIVGDQDEYNRLKPVAPFLPRKRNVRDAEDDVIPGVPPPALKAIPYVVNLPQAPIPERISSSLSHGSIAGAITHFRNAHLPKILESVTYGRHFKALLWAEEYRSEQDLQVYDIANAKLKRHNAYFYLGVPGLAEKRPSVLVGDSILLQQHGAAKGRWYEGRVHVVNKEEVGMRFSASFPYSESQRYTARFKLNRYPLRRQHQALDTAFAPDRVLFPTRQHIHQNVLPSISDVRTAIYNKLIAQNPPQLRAVTSIVQQQPGSAPFVIFGPPGTGKTVTTVEAILQVLRINPKARILACAPSNSAADLIALRLNRLRTDELFRFYAPSRYKDQVPDELLRYTCVTAAGHFTIPPVATMKRYRVIVTTCVSASVAYGIGMPRGHFSHIFVDEAGQATEPEVMIGVKTMADNDTNVILSGDPKQLGPIIRSAVARELGLEKSFLARLMELESYDERGQGVSVVKLVQNFRSHPSILRFPNTQFYNGDLQPFGDVGVINSLLDHPVLVNKKFPIVFHALSGKDDREASSPSFFNVLEALQVKAYIEQLRSNRRFRISDAEIGVITPYHAQCRRIRMALKGFADEVKVGSVEELQGQERRAVIISTVRSSREFVEYDLKHTLGFVANPRRLNVAITRAQALLVIVGDPSVLSLDPLWRSFLNYIHVNGGWRGDAPSWDTRAPVRESGGYDEELREAGLADMSDFTRRMESLTLRGVTGEADSDEDEVNVDRPWREVE